jgi:predicted  nucleic acid-binding Zn-ribbon protein
LELEIEKNEDLRLQIEVMKVTNESASSAIVSAVDDMKKRYFSLKEELAALRVERKARESDYNLIQKDLKLTEQYEKLISNLKSSLAEGLRVKDVLSADYRQFKSEFGLTMSP